jgi:hypothetical protein
VSVTESPVKESQVLYYKGDKNEAGGKETDNRVPCMYCKRSFMLERIDKHQQICEANFLRHSRLDKKSPRVVESTKALKHQISLKKPNSKWRIQHLDLIQKLRVDDYCESYDEYITCPHCHRKFAPGPAEKHLEKCKDIINKPRPPPRKLDILPKISEKNFDCGREENSSAREKLGFRNLSYARISKRSIVDEALIDRASIVQGSVDKTQRFIKFRKKKLEIHDGRLGSLYKIEDSLCKCGEILPSRAKFCMMCGKCRASENA